MLRMQGEGKNGRQVFVFGLARENIERLTHGEPIQIALDAFGLTGPPCTLYLAFGETEEALAVEFQDLIGPQTRVQDHRHPRRHR